MKQIEIDTEVYGLLEDKVQGFERPNDVLRRLLGFGPSGTGAGGPGEVGPQPWGKLGVFIEAGLVKPGDSLVFEQVRKGLVHNGHVGEGDTIVTEKGTYEAPSQALSKLVNGQINGWVNWKHVPSGKSLDALREQLGKM